ncbi:sigma-70 family RNA polymerase sigma factor [Paenarthrobacter sp. RAF9]
MNSADLYDPSPEEDSSAMSAEEDQPWAAQETPKELAGQSDADLLEATRAGDLDAYARLWTRHQQAIETAARYFTSFDPEDITAEVFLRILAAIQAGKGPTGLFRPYALRSARNLAAEWARKAAPISIDTIDDFADPRLSDFSASIGHDRNFALDAFRSLPLRWQEVIWYSEIENLSPAEIAPLIGLSANSTAALTFRAREGLRQAYLSAHLNMTDLPAECRWVAEHAARYIRGKLSRRAQKRLETHVLNCLTCPDLLKETEDIGATLGIALLPVVLGPAAAGYLKNVPQEPALSAPGPEAGLPAKTPTRPGLLVAAAALVLAVTLLTSSGGPGDNVGSDETSSVLNNAPTLTIRQASELVIPSIGGQATPGSIVSVAITGEGSSQSFTVRTSDSGQWSAEVPATSAGHFTISSQQGSGDQTSKSPDLTYSISPAPTILITPALEGTATNLELTGLPLSQILETDPDGTHRRHTTTAEGTFNRLIPVPPGTVATWTFRYEVHDQLGLPARPTQK